MRVMAAVSVVVLLLGVAARAVEPTSKPADLSSPRAALTSLAEALKAGDVDKAGKAVLVSEENDKKFVEQSLKFEAALEKLAAAVDQKFGEGSSHVLREQLKQNAAPTNAVPALEKAAADAPDSSSEDSITINSNAMGEFKMARVDGDWKLDASDMLKDMQPNQKQQGARQLPGATKKLEQLNEQLTSGKITSIDDIAAALKAKQ